MFEELKQNLGLGAIVFSLTVGVMTVAVKCLPTPTGPTKDSAEESDDRDSNTAQAATVPTQDEQQAIDTQADDRSGSNEGPGAIVTPAQTN